MNDLETRHTEELLMPNGESELRLIYQDESMVIIDKPSGLMTHKSRIAEDNEYSAMERLRDQIGAWVYPVHRLDRATSGALVFGKDQESARALHQAFANGAVHKRYWAVTRGHAPESEEIDRPLKEKRDRITDRNADQNKAPQEAKTSVKTLAHCVIPVALGRYPSARFSLVDLSPKTGRRHQLRRHLAGINYPIIGDTTHGRGEQNRFFRDQFLCDRLLLAAVGINLPHPKSGQGINLEVPLSGVMSAVCRRLFLDEKTQAQSLHSAHSYDIGILKSSLGISSLTWLSDRREHLHLFAVDQA